MNKYSLTVRILIYLLLAFLIVSALIITRTLLVPLFFAILLAYLFLPTAKRLEKRGLSRIATNFLLISTLVIFVLGALYFMILLVASFVGDLPQIQEQIRQNLNNFQNSITNLVNISEDRQESMIENVLENTGQFLSSFFTATANTVLQIALIPVYTFLLLLYRSKLKKFISMLVPSGQKETTQNIFDQAAKIVPQYLKGLFIVCLILIVINSLGFFLIGVKYALLLGIIAAIFNLIPYLGTVLGYGFVFLFVLSTQTPGVALGVVIQFFIIQFIENNILTPNITGSYVKINPLVIIFSLLAGGMIWGLPGMFMVIPYLALMKLLCENITSLKPVGFLLGTRGNDQHSFSFKFFKS